MVSITHERMVIPRLKQELMRKVVSQGVRIDGRELLDYRPIKIDVGPVKTADGSAIVTLGNTKVIAGVKVEIGEPFEDTPDEGGLVVNLEIAPTAAPDIEPGPPDENAIEIARVIDRAIRHSGFIDLKSLCIEPGKYAWILWIDIYVINHDGNLFDAASLAAAAALLNTTIPKAEVDQTSNTVRVDRSVRQTLNANIERLPITLTYAKFGGSIIADPTREEEDLAEGLMVIGIAEGRVVALQKVSGVFSKDEVFRIIDSALSQYPRLRDLVVTAAKSPIDTIRL